MELSEKVKNVWLPIVIGGIIAVGSIVYAEYNISKQINNNPEKGYYEIQRDFK